ncbi:DUF2161 domain-containing phosphodiesterase [Cohnella candidum]|uniref:Uncharacterized protein n=1 Tax=Cohnella candidum TaxID=2674991 RepID=A0A3G3K191_9BACL|nr:DUF2161 family putative PD-(D/E)XK-type phosphodiesterase [Cohnella candidum]AYQ73539.1 hypothetical protein EAV92_13705 [Cohnella candidum]
MAVARETELYPPVKRFFEARGYAVKAEIRGCDLVAVRPDEANPLIVEMKKIFTLPLLLQGVDRQKTGASVWLAVERNRTKKGAHNQRYHELTELCRRLRLGFLTVTFYKTKDPVIDVWCEPGPAPAASAALAVAAETAAAYGADRAPAAGRSRSRKAARLLQEFEARSGDYNVGGSTGRKLVTAYRERSLQCALALCCHGPSSPKNVREWTGNPKAGAMLRDNVYGWFSRVGKGVYRLMPAGELALREYGEVTSVWASRFPWAANWATADRKEPTPHV